MRDGLFYSLMTSVFLHFFLFWAARFLPAPPPPEAVSERVEIEVKNVIYKERQQVVRDTVVPDHMKSNTSDDPLAFFSAQNQRVKRQLRALQQSGLTANRSPRADKREGKANHRNLFKLATKNGIDPVDPSKIEEVRFDQIQMPSGLSSVGEALPEELEIGSFTALNTDRYLYYSFFTRIEELIRHRWETAVRSTADRQPRGFFQTHLHSTWTTQVEIMLKPNGEFHKAVLLKGSGLDGFDWAAMDSFADARIFPHPPHEMVESDGYIHLRYLFKVHTNPKAFVRR